MVGSHGGAASASPSRPSPRKPVPPRVKDRRDDALARDCALAVAADAAQRQQQRALRFHARWHHVRVFYATVTERLPEPKRKIWLRRLAAQLRDAVVGGSAASLAQAESALTTALHALVASAPAWREILAALHAVVAAFQREGDETSTFDCRELLCACCVLDRWQDGELRMLALWMDEYSLPTPPVGDMAIKASDVKQMLATPCAGTTDEHQVAPFIARLLGSVAATKKKIGSSSEWVRVADIKAFVETTPALRSLLKDLCWRRLIDDMRLGFFRDVYRLAMERVEREEGRVRLAAAMQVWRLREPRARLARWKDFVATQKLRRRGDAQFRAVAQHKAVRHLCHHRERRQQLRRWLADARAAYERSLVRWTLRVWQLLRLSMVELHRVAWRRSVRHFEDALSARVWKAFVAFVEAARAEKARRQALLDAFVARRHLKIVRHSWGEWMFVFRRQKEVRVAMQLERQLHGDIEELRREETELVRMTVEDAASEAVEQKERELVEQARRRAFQEASDRVFANRKIKQQEEERTQFKRAREQRVLAEMDDAWARIGERVAAEVRASTLAWFNTAEGKRAVQTEAAEIYERDPIAIQKALLQDPQAFALPGCRWQLRLEDYGGRFAKAFFINVETLEKVVCDELVMENCEEIAREVLVQRKIDDARARLRAKAGDVQLERRQHDAALKIQMLFRCRHALLVARSKIRAGFVKRVEPTSGDVVYFNIAKQETRRRPPRLMGSDEPLIPVESSTWVRRVDDAGNDYYLHQETGETSWTPPPHHFMCSACKHNLATRRWNESGARFCVVCVAEGIKKGRFAPVAAWTKLSVQPAKCVVCRNGLAVAVCHQCRGDATCWGCCQAVHCSLRCAGHTEMDYLVYS